VNKQSFLKRITELDSFLYLKFKGVVVGSDGDTTKSLYRIFLFALVTTVAVFLLNVALRLPETQWRLGDFGDFFGGVLNPILTFLMFIGLIITIVIQKTELSLARNEFERTANALQAQSESSKKQVIESTFFNLLNIHNQTLESLRFDSESLRCVLDSDNKKTVGRAVFSSILSWMHDQEGLQKARDCYDYFQTTENHIVGHYFRGLYQILKFVDECGLSDEDKNNYSRLLRAQLSTDELGLIVFNCISPNVDSGQFRALLIKYRMLEHLRLEKQEYGPCYIVSSCTVYAEKEDLLKYIQFDQEGSVVCSAFGSNPVAVKELYI